MIEVAIIVEGPAGCGKSAIAQRIAHYLRDAGLKTTITDADYQPRSSEQQQTVFDSIADRVEVKVMSRQLPRWRRT